MKLSDQELFEFRTTDTRQGNVLKRPRKAIIAAESQKDAEAELKVNRSTRRRQWRFYRKRPFEGKATVIVVFSQQGE